MNTRRRFIEILPLAGISLLAACSDKAVAPAAPAATPAPEPVAAQPAPAAAPAPAAEPAPAPAPAPTAGMPVLDEKDPVALGLGYVADASKADGAKFKNYAAGQQCANCAVYGGAAGSAMGPCPIFAGRQVNAKGWCSAYAKKAV